MAGMGTPIGIGLIGAGRHGIRYARHLVQDVPQARLRAICRRRPDQELDVPGTEQVARYGSVADLIADRAVQAVIAVVPPVLHKDICLAAVAAGKPVLIEKPLATTAEDARAMVAAADAAGVPLMTAQTLRFDQAIQELLTWRPSIGRPQHLVLTSRIETKGRERSHAEGYGGRGALLEFGVHLLDLVWYLTGEDICEVRCTMDQFPPNAPDTLAMVQLVTSSGMPCVIEVARVAAGRVGRAEWIGSEGQAAVDWSRRHGRVMTAQAPAQEQAISPSQTVLLALQAFVKALAQGTPMPVTGHDGLRAVELADACYRSAANGGRPILF